jgi:hypothetical protein
MRPTTTPFSSTRRRWWWRPWRPRWGRLRSRSSVSHRPQPSSASRRTAGAFGFLNLSQSGRAAGAVSAPPHRPGACGVFRPWPLSTARRQNATSGSLTFSRGLAGGSWRAEDEAVESALLDDYRIKPQLIFCPVYMIAMSQRPAIRLAVPQDASVAANAQTSHQTTNAHCCCGVRVSMLRPRLRWSSISAAAPIIRP